MAEEAEEIVPVDGQQEKEDDVGVSGDKTSGSGGGGGGSGGGGVVEASESETEAAAAVAAATDAATADLKVRRVIVETLTQEELDYFRSIRDYLSTLKQPDREKWIIQEMQKFRAEVEEEEKLSDVILAAISSHEQEEDAENPDADGETGSREENASPRVSVEKASTSTADAAVAAISGEALVTEEEEQLTEEEKAFLAFQADEAKKCLLCHSYCHMEGDEDYLYLPCSMCEKRICHMCKRFCYKCGELICSKCIFIKPKTGRKYCHHCFNDTRLNDRVLKCEICFLKVEIDERIISCWRCYSVACMKTCGRYSVDGFICRRCIGELKEQEEMRDADDNILADGYEDGNINAKYIKLPDYDLHNITINKESQKKTASSAFAIARDISAFPI